MFEKVSCPRLTTSCLIFNISFNSPDIKGNCFARKLVRIRHNSCPNRVASNVGVGRLDMRPSSPTLSDRSEAMAACTRLSDPNIESRTKESSKLFDALLPESSMRSRSRNSGTDNRRVRSKAQKRTTCSYEARRDSDMSVDELAGYFDEQVQIPRKMSFMAELMYT